MLPTKDKAAVVLKNAEILVIVPALGIEKAKLVKVPAGFVKSMVPPAIASPGAELPKPMKAGVPINPPVIVVKETGIPEANGMIALAPVGPVGPVGPVMPAGPVAPVLFGC